MKFRCCFILCLRWVEVSERGVHATRCRVQVERLVRCLGRCCSSLGNKDCCGKPGERGAFHRRMKNDRVTNPPQSLQSLRAVSSSHGSTAAVTLLLLLLLLDNPLLAPGQGIESAVPARTLVPCRIRSGTRRSHLVTAAWH